MNRKESLGILQMNQEEAIRRIRELAEKAELYNLLFTPADPTSPFGLTGNYKKPNHFKPIIPSIPFTDICTLIAWNRSVRRFKKPGRTR